MTTSTPAEVSGLRGPRALAIFAAATLFGAALDLISKSYAFAHLPEPPDGIVVISGCFNLIKAQNRGAAFSILNGQVAFFIAISILALGLLGYFSWNAVRSGA